MGAAQLKFCTGLEIKLDAGGSHVGPKAQLISAGEVRTKKRKQTQKHLEHRERKVKIGQPNFDFRKINLRREQMETQETQIKKRRMQPLIF